LVISFKIFKVGSKIKIENYFTRHKEEKLPPSSVVTVTLAGGPSPSGFIT